MNDRIKKLHALLEKKRLDAVLISDVYDICYLTGFSNFAAEEREAFLLIAKKGNYIITDGRYAEAIRRNVSTFTLIERTIQNSLKEILKKLVKKHQIKKCGFDENNISVSEHKIFSRYLNDLNHFSIGDLRIRKDESEIHAIKQACKINDKAFTYILKQIKAGITEKQLAFELELYIKKQGADLSFPSIVAFGANAAIPHHQTGDTKLKANSFVLLDFGVKFDNYCSDMTRTVFFGKPTEKQKKIYETVRIAQQNAIQLITYNLGLITSNKTSLKASEVDRVARKYIIDSGFPTTPHSLGHGIGIEVHEAPSLSPKSKQLLEDGMVFSIEPGIYIPNFGGVRIEDLFVIHNNQLIQLTKSPKSLIAL